MIPDWSQLTPAEFEQVCYRLLEAAGFKNLRWYGKAGGDKGRDIVGEKTEHPLPGTERLSHWVVQCKRYLKGQPSKGELKEFLASATEHRPDSVLVIVSTTFSPDIKEWIKAVDRDYPFDIHTWEEMDLQRELARHRAEISVDFPRLYGTGETILFYAMSRNEYQFACNEFEEVYI